MTRLRANVSRLLRFKGLVVGLALLYVLPSPVHADAFDAYSLVQEFDLPAGAGPFDVMGDGRLIVMMDDEVLVETAAGSRNFSLHGVLPGADIALFGPAFIRVSPGGTKIAVGNNGGASFVDFEVGVFDLASLSGDWFSAGHFEAAWIDNRHLALTAGDFVVASVVTALDTQSPDPANPTNIIIVDNIGGASGGIAFDRAGNLYTGNGFSFIGPSGTGAVKAFDHASWSAALSGGPALDFEDDGTLIVDILSASPLRLDRQGNLIVGGGDFFSSTDLDFVAVIRASVVNGALLGMAPADPSDPGDVRRLDPDPANDFNFFSVLPDPVTNQLYVWDSSDSTVFVYADRTAAIPTVSEWGMVCMALVLLTVAKVVFAQPPRSASKPAY